MTLYQYQERDCLGLRPAFYCFGVTPGRTTALREGLLGARACSSYETSSSISIKVCSRTRILFEQAIRSSTTFQKTFEYSPNVIRKRNQTRPAHLGALSQENRRRACTRGSLRTEKPRPPGSCHRKRISEMLVGVETELGENICIRFHLFKVLKRARVTYDFKQSNQDGGCPTRGQRTVTSCDLRV